MNDTERQAVANLCIANGNLQIGICKDDASEILRALNHLEKAQVLTGTALYNLEQIESMRKMALARIQENQLKYLAIAGAPNATIDA